MIAVAIIQHYEPRSCSVRQIFVAVVVFATLGVFVVHDVHGDVRESLSQLLAKRCVQSLDFKVRKTDSFCRTTIVVGHYVHHIWLLEIHHYLDGK